jgi:hypothetical protein
VTRATHGLACYSLSMFHIPIAFFKKLQLVYEKLPHISNDAPPLGGASLVDSMAPVSSICKSCTSTMTFPMLPTIESIRSRKVRAGDGNSKKKRFKDDTSMKLTYLEVWAVHHLLAQQHLEMV